jgi:hypothetical protein
MLTLTGVPSGQSPPWAVASTRKPARSFPLDLCFQVEGLDNRGLVQLFTLTVPDTKPFEGRVGEQVTVPVRAWAPGASSEPRL